MLATEPSSRGKRVLEREVTKNLMVTLAELQRSNVGMREASRWTTFNAALMKTWSRVLRTSCWAKGSPSDRTMTPSTQPGQRKGGLGTTLCMCLIGWTRALTCSQSQFPDLKMSVHEGLIQLYRAWEDLKKRKTENPWIQACKACCIILRKPQG